MTHWKKLTNPDYLGAYALEDGKDIVLTIRSVAQETVIGTDGKKEECAVCHFVENVKPMILNATNMKMIADIYKTPYVENWSGKQIKIGTERVRAFGTITEALRVRNEIPNNRVYLCEVCGNEIKAIGSKSAEYMAQYTEQKYGKMLCAACAMAAAESAKNETAKEPVDSEKVPETAEKESEVTE